MNNKNKFSKFPWGILFGISLMVFSLLVIAVIAVKIISYLMIVNSGGDDGLGSAPWINVAIVFAVIFGLTTVACLVLYFLRNKKYGKIKNEKGKFTKKSVLVLLSTYLITLFVITLVAGEVLNQNYKVINTALNLTGTRTEVVEDDSEIDSEYFKSEFVKKDASGNPKLITDKNGYTHQEYDDEALRKETEATAEQVQREGSTLLWNSDTNGLPLSEGNKVSLFSYSTIDWLESGAGSGVSQVNSQSTMLYELNQAGLEVNETLWNFYKGLDKATYSRLGNYKMNEVPWNVYTSDVKNSFNTYNDAAILVFSRLTREASNGGHGGDACLTGADTPTGDYFDLSYQEEEMLNEVISLKKNGVFKKIIVLLNTPAGMFMDSFVENKEYIDTLMWVGFTGYQGLHELGNILAGKSIPSGHLADTFAYNTSSAPASVNIQAKQYINAKAMNFTSSKATYYLTYAENIYVGYKYYETRYEDVVLNRGNANGTMGVKNSTSTWKYSEEVAFPFGHGDSYTDFEFSSFSVKQNANGDYDVTVKVTNTGNNVGKEVAQIYVQKPYTEYDKQYGIEQASVNLAGYAKTKLLEPGASQTLLITVRDDAFKTYDAHNKKTYIREKTSGDDAYYIALAHNSHEAINNILAKKGKTPLNTANRMDSEGNASFVVKYDFNNDDFDTYSVSEVTDYPITNQFDDVDWNKYQYKSSENITYLTRNDWEGTYPTAPVGLSLNDNIIADLANEHGAPVVDGDVMPLYGQTHEYNLIDLMGLEYDDPKWEVLLNQLTVDEQIKLVGSAYFGTIAISSIGKPADVAADGPLGLKKTFTYSTFKSMSYPSPTVLSASFNDELALRVGELMGEDGLHSGTTGLYAPGVNIHRSTYGARNWEYHSEDPFLSGMIAKYRVIGSQSKGCYVHLKHFALNDQESYRHGVNVWCNEQALRELYLNAYEYAATEGKATGFMTSFTRFGTHWSGAHKGLCTEVSRNEWGIKGFILSDSAWQSYMGVVDGLLAGNDAILSNVNLAMYDVAKTNPTVAKALRESTHRILYTIGNSNVMNGITNGIKIHQVQEWWQFLVVNIQIAMGVITIGFVLITALFFIFDRPLKKEDDENKEIEQEINKEEVDNKNPKKKKNHTMKILFISLLSTVVVSGSIIAPSSMKELYPDYSYFTEKIPLRDRIEGEGSIYTLEAENAYITTDIVNLNTALEGKTKEEVNNPSGTGFISRLENEGDAYISFYLTSNISTNAVLGFKVGRSDTNVNINSMFEIEINGGLLHSRKYDHNVEPTSNNDLINYDWVEVDACLIDLVEGMNLIKLTKIKDADKFLNLDNLYLYTSASIDYEDREFNTYTFDCNENNDPFKEEFGGSLEDPDYTFKAEGSEGKLRYGNLNEAIVTSTVVVNEPTIALLAMIGDARPGKTFSAIAISSDQPHIKAFHLNEENGQYITSTRTYPSIGWNNYRNQEIASIYLSEGENVIYFEIGGDNINMCGITLFSPVPVKLKNQADPEPPLPGKDYRFDVNDAADPSIEDNECNPFVARNGGSRVDNSAGGSYKTESYGLYKYSDGNGSKLTVTLVSEAKTTVHFYLINDCRPKTSTGEGNSVFSYNQVAQTNDRPNPYIPTLTLNGSTEGVTPSTKQYESIGWNRFMDCELAILELNAGNNVIYFEIGGDNINYTGIVVRSEVAISLPRVDNPDEPDTPDTPEEPDTPLEFKKYRFDTNEAAVPSNEDNECNPFVARNGGSRVDNYQGGSYKTESYGLYKYSDGNGSKLTVTLVSEAKTTVHFYLINDCRPKTSTGEGNSVFSYNQVAQTNDRPNPYIPTLTLNGSTEGVTPSTKQYESIGWNRFMDCELATLELKAGNNVIYFEIGGDNINYTGIVVESQRKISLASTSNSETTYVFNTNKADDPSIENNAANPFSEMNGGSVVDADNNCDYRAENKVTYRYGGCNNATFTFVLNLSEADDVTLYIIADCRPATSTSVSNSVFSYNQQPKTNSTNNPYIKASTINGSSEGITPSSKTYSSIGWNNFSNYELGVYSLVKGVNTITFTIGGDNINVCGVVVVSNATIKLGK